MTRIIHKPEFNEKLYSERVNRTEVFLGRTHKEQKQAQKILSESTVGIAGTGGIGGAVALRLARFGIKKLKIADPETFDWSNINRQLGATKNNAGKNKSETVGEIVHDLAGDVEIEVFTDGITVENAEEFVDECDIVLDQLEFTVIKERYALHRAFRNNKNIKHILCCAVVGWAAHLYKFEHDSMTFEDWYGVDENQEINAEIIDRMIKLIAAKFPHFPSYSELRRWMQDNNGAVPIFAGAPPLAEGILVPRTILGLLGKEYSPYAKWLPPIPQMYAYDAATLTGEIITSDGNFKNTDEQKIIWDKFDAASV